MYKFKFCNFVKSFSKSQFYLKNIMGPSGSISYSMLPILFWQCLLSIRIVRHRLFLFGVFVKVLGAKIFFLKKNRFFVKCPSLCNLTGTFSHVLYFNCALFLSSMMFYNVPGLSGILDFSYISCLGKKEPPFLLILQEKQSKLFSLVV